MADRNVKRKSGRLSRNPSTESADETQSGMGKSVKEKRHKKPKERFLLTRKTWRYMADAGRKLIPEGVHNRPEDIPKIEAYFQEVCKREPNFLLWRKNSYPGALGFRSSRKRKERKKSGSWRKASSADELELVKPQRPKDLSIHAISGGRFDLQKMKYDFLNQPPSYYNSNQAVPKLDSPSQSDEPTENQLIDMLEKYLTISNREVSGGPSTDLNYQELVDRLQRYLTSASQTVSQPYVATRRQQVHFEGDHFQKSLAETLSRYFSRYPNRDKVISDLLTDRKALEKLYFELRQAKGFRGARSGSYSGTNQPSQFWSSSDLENFKGRREPFKKSNDYFVLPPPLIEVQGESSNEPTYDTSGVQTDRVPEAVLAQADEEYKKLLAEREEENREFKSGMHRRRSSVDNDDVSQSVSDTIKRYLRMARKKSVDGKQGDRFKRVNYDRNLRNIKAKGEITKPGDDDGLSKGCQTNEDWIVYFKNNDSSENLLGPKDVIDVGNNLECEKPATNRFLSSSQSFLSNLLHGKHSQDKTPSPTATAGAMQKSKSSSSVMHQGTKLVAKKIFRSRSKSQTRPAPTHSSWTPQGRCMWTSMSGKQVILEDTTLMQLSNIEKKLLQKVALAKLQSLNLGVTVKIPSETASNVPQKTKRRPYLLKRKALTTSFFDASRKDGDKDKENSSSTGGLVFGIPLSQCVDNDRLLRGTIAASAGDSIGESNLGRHASRASFSSLIDTPRDDEIDSSEDYLPRDRLIIGSVPGHLNKISAGSTADILATTRQEEFAVPHILRECIRSLENFGLHTVGIFRVSSSKKRVRQLREDFDCGKETSLGDDQCPHDVATLLKEYLRDLPDPLLCKDLYNAFIQTQKIRHRRIQLEAIEHLIQLLPTPNRDTLLSLLTFLATVARHSESQTTSTGECLQGNKMDSNNLATVFAPNVLHCNKPNSKEATERPEDHLDVINVFRILIDHNKTLFNVPAELLDEVYIEMMDCHPEMLDNLLNKRCAALMDDFGDDFDSESNSAPLTPTIPTSHMTIEHLVHTDSDSCNTPPERKKFWSREEFLHEATATGGGNVNAKVKANPKDPKDRIRDRVTKKRRDDSVTRRKRDDENNNPSAGMAKSLMSRLRNQKDEDVSLSKLRSSSLDSNGSIPSDANEMGKVLRTNEEMQGTDRRKSTPYISDNHGVITASLTIPVQASSQPLSFSIDHTDIPYIEDSSYSLEDVQTMGKRPEVPRRRNRSTSGSDSSVSAIQPITGSLSLTQGCDSAIGSSSATISSYYQHNTAPSSISSSIADAGSPLSCTSTPPTSPDSVRAYANYISEDNFPTRIAGRPAQKFSTVTKEVPTLQKVEHKHTPKQGYEVQKATSTPIIRSADKQPKFTPSITSIGNAVLKSRTADFEKISKSDPKSKTPTVEKKKYTKRRYTDSKHPTRHIPDSESLEAGSVQQKDELNTPQSGTVYKRRELISSVFSK